MLLLRGLAIGFTIAAPIGPVGILCVRRALSHGRIAGIAAALGAAFADCGFGAAIGLGIGSIHEILAQYQSLLRIIGGLFLLVLGWGLCRTTDKTGASAGNGGGSWVKDAVSSFVITITNPGTILGVIGVFAALGPMDHLDGTGQRGLFIGGIFLGSLLWWTILSSIAAAARSRISTTGLCRFEMLSGAVLMVFGGIVLISVVWTAL